MQPCDGSKSSLNWLPDDVLALIVEEVHRAHSPSLRALRLVAKRFDALAQYITLSTLVLELDSAKTTEFAHYLDLIDSRGLHAAIRSIRATRRRSVSLMEDANDTPSNVERGLQRFSLMTGLRDVMLSNCGLSPQFCNALVGLPQVRLHVTLHSCSGHTGLNDFLDLLKNNINLYALDIRHTYYDAQDCLELTRPLKQILLTSPGIRELTLDIGQPSSGCVIYFLPIEYCGMGLQNGETPPALEKLHLIKYPFHRNDPRHEIEYWAANFDWSRLRSFTSFHPQLPCRLTPYLTALHEVDLGSAPNQADFYMNVPSCLRSITLKTMEDLPLNCITRHGSTLQSLTIHQPETWDKPWNPETTISLPDLLQIRASCPHITTLNIDTCRVQDPSPSSLPVFPTAILSALATFSHLTHLTLHFDLGFHHPNRTISLPKITFSTAQMLFTFLRDPTSPSPPPLPTHRTRLQQFDLYSGPPPSPPTGPGMPSAPALWPSANSMHFRCTPAIRDDDAAEGKLFCECPGLSATVNRVLRGEEMAPWLSPAEEEAMLVARDGPLDLDEWLARKCSTRR